jgi:hypothetical protein
MRIDIPGQRYLFPFPSHSGPITHAPFQRKDLPTMAPLTPEDRTKLFNAAAMLKDKLQPGATPGALATIDWRQILAQILEQIGPILIAIIVSFLNHTETTKPSKT